MTTSPEDRPVREIYPLLALGFKRPLLTAGMKEGIIPEGHVNGPAEGTAHAVRDYRAVPVPSDRPDPEPVKVQVEKTGPKEPSSPVISSAEQSSPGSSESGEQKIPTEILPPSPTHPSESQASPVDAAKASPLSLVGLPLRTTGEPVPPAETTGAATPVVSPPSA